MLITFWKPLLNVTFILKSGAQIKIKCEKISYKHDNNELTNYAIEGNPTKHKLLYCRIDDISAIVVDE